MPGTTDQPEAREIFEISRANRLIAADLLDGLSAEQWSTPSLCAGWSVRHVAAHLVSTLESRPSVLTIVRALLRHRGNLNRWVDAQTRRVAERSPADLVAALRRHAAVELDPPVVGPRGPMTDTCIHLRDVARPLGLDVHPVPESWGPALDLVTDPRRSRGVTPRGVLAGLQLVRTDAAATERLRWGSGDDVTGTGEALALAATGRRVALADLDGPGVGVLDRRLDAL